MMKHFSTIIAVAIIAVSALAAEPEASPLPGRPETNVVLKIENGDEFQMTYPAHPYVDTNGWVSLLPGESHLIEFDVRDGKPVNPRWVIKRTKGKDAISLNFTNDGQIAMLSIQSNCSKIITMKCLHQVAGRRGLYQTGINPINPGLYSFHSWPPQVVSMLLFDFQFWDDYDTAFEQAR